MIQISSEQQSTYVEAMKVKGNKNKFSFYANTEIAVSKPDSAVPIAFSNPSFNDSVLLCQIVDSDGVIVFRSLGVVPGKYITNVKFSDYLDYGENELTMYVTAFRAVESENGVAFEQVGKQKTDIKIVCGEDYGS